ncbi:MAG: GAF domain-containing sensor histidine kinase [Anaerolineae bacterium]|jgi:signal transduction histidine kinase|nr:GAF domain-containing sensor histidine kinase [Anaerolineae bacterium]
MPAADSSRLHDPDRLALVQRLQHIRTPAPLLPDLVQSAARLCSSPAGFISLVLETRVVFEAHTGFTTLPTDVPIGATFCQHIIALNAALVVTDAHRHPLLYDLETLHRYGWRALIGVPVHVNGQPAGVLCVLDQQPRDWQGHEVAALQTLAQLAATCLHQRLHEADLAAREQRVLEQEQAIGHLLGSATHRLMGLLHVLYGRVEQEPERQPLLTTLDSTLHEMRLLINDMVLLTAGADPLTGRQQELVNLGTETERVLLRLEADRHEKRLTLEKTLHSGCFVPGNQAMLHEAIHNLVSNAIKYTPDGGTIRVLVTRQAEEVVVEIRDTGYGIPAAYQPQLFQPFFRATTRETAPIRGTGLGLYLVKSIITRHGGSVFFESEYGHGSRFGFRLRASPLPPAPPLH